MRVVIDKIEANPPHALSPVELRTFLRLMPGELKRDVAMVRLSSAVEHSASWSVAAFSRLEQRLVIASRRVSRDVAMLEVLRCLVRKNWRRHERDRDNWSLPPQAAIDARAKELFAQISAQMPIAPHWSRVHLKYMPQRKESEEPNKALQTTTGSSAPSRV